MKRFLTHLFVFAANYYLLSILMGIILMAATLFVGALNEYFCVGISLLILSICIIYQFVRNRFSANTFGDLIVGSTDKQDILVQAKAFSITRWPLFLLIGITLLLNSQPVKEVGDGQVYNLGFVIFYTLLFFCTYYGINNFCVKPDMLPLFLIIGGLLYASVMYKNSSVLFIPGFWLSNIYYLLIVIWLITGLIYKRYAIENNDTSN